MNTRGIRINGKVLVILIVWFGCMLSCQPVKPYQRMYLDDHAMRFQGSAAVSLEQNAQIYREGASGGGASKPSGGCGCN